MQNENLLLKKLESEMRERIDLMVFKIGVLEKSNENLVSGDNLNNDNVNKGPHISRDQKSPYPDPSSQQPVRSIVKSRSPYLPPSNEVSSNLTANRKDNHPQLAASQVTRSSTIVGSNKTVNSNLLAAIPQDISITYLYVYNLKSDTTENILKEYLVNKGNCSLVNVMKLKADDFGSSFKVGIPKAEVNYIMDGGFWPEGVKVRLFRFKQQSKRTYEQTNFKSKKTWRRNQQN